MVRHLSLTLWALVLLLPVQAMAEAIVFDRILVKINDDIITQYDLDEDMKPFMAKIGDRELSTGEKEQLEKLRKKTLDRMVNDTLMAQEIKRYEIVIPDAIVDKEIERIKKDRDMTDEEFEAMLQKEGEDLEMFRKNLKGIIEKQELLGVMVHSKVLVTDSEIEAEYKERREDFLLDKMITLAIIILPPETSAVEVRKRILDGELSFTEAVQEYSVGPGKDKGGSIGEVEWDDLADDWRESIEGVEAGGVGTPLTVRGKEALLSPVTISEDRMIPLEEVKDSIFKRLMDTKREKIFEEYFEKLKQRSVIVYMD